MDAALPYTEIAARLKHFLGMESACHEYPRGSSKVLVEWDMPEGSCRLQHFPYTCLSRGVLISKKGWLYTVIKDMKMEVAWDYAADIDKPTVSVCFKLAKVDSTYPMLHYPGLLFLWDSGTAILRTHSLRVGDHVQKLSVRPACVSSSEDGSSLEWKFELDGQRLLARQITFVDRFGSNKVQMELELTKTTVDEILSDDIEEILKKCSESPISMSDRDDKIVKLHRQEILARRHCTSVEFFILKSDGFPDEIRVFKATLALRSPAFATCFQHPESDEMKQNCYTVPGSTPEGLTDFVVYCESFLVPDMQTHYLELARLAHKYAVVPLLDLCEVYMMCEVSTMVRENLGGENFDGFLQICKVATQLELPLLVVQLHFVVASLEQKIVHLPDILDRWQMFLVNTPGFGLTRYEMVKRIATNVIKKRKLDGDSDEED